MKPPDHPNPSGDRYIARLLIDALTLAGFNVELASRLRSWQGKGDQQQLQKIKNRGLATVKQLISHYEALPDTQRPHCWFTYHLYHKAPDWIGPEICDALNIPYFVAEASVSSKQAHGPWQTGYRSSIRAIQRANAIFCLNPIDAVGVKAVAAPHTEIVDLKPFLESPAALQNKAALRHRIAVEQQIDPDQYWLLCVAMMRQDSKAESYLLLADALSKVKRKDWQLIVIGDGPARDRIKRAFQSRPNIHFLGQQEKDYVRQCMTASDLFVWPAIKEAFGMAVLESLSCGLPVIAGCSGGIDQIVEQARTGILIKNVGDASLAQQIECLLDSPKRLAEMSAQSRKKFLENHTIEKGADKLKNTIFRVTENTSGKQI